MSVVSIINQKGGVAKTTTSINLAASWAQDGKNILLIDLDPQASATKAIFSEQGFEATIYDVLIGRLAAHETIVHSDKFEIDVIPSEILLSGIDVQLAAHFGRERILRKKLEPLKRKYDAIIIDCSPSLGLLTINALLASKDIIIPICPEYFSLKGIELILDTLKNLRKGLDYNVGVRGLIITRYRNRRIVNDVLEEIKACGLNVCKSYVPDAIVVEEAHHQHLPLIKYAPHNKATKAYESLSEELWV